ncbi:helix-turn-helix transcriptional regulator [Arthrobacter sp. HY1533]|uniref:helix-turn-helix transcriptional regulator n=1 Tax=Arthrobacter sp. HY1533 TaxID=2970919 RepID=UPI0022B9E3E6|nr:AraC family transcriptional regulator [Arthrobacter sp. HY1533]
MESTAGKRQRIEEAEALLERAHAIPSGVFGRYECEPGWTWKPRFSDFDLWWVLHGYGHARINGEPEIRIEPGTLLLLRPGDTGDFRQDPQAPLTVLSSHFELLDMATGLPLELDGRHFPRRRHLVNDKGQISDLMTRLVRSRSEPSLFRSLVSRGLLLELLAVVYKLDAAADGVQPEIDHRLNSALAIIGARPSQRLALGEVAAAAGLSPKELSGLFVRQLGVTFRRHTVDVRMERAQFLLNGTDLSVGQIARSLGYPDQFLFSRQFRAKFGMPPSQYRDSVHNLGLS